MLTEFDDVVIRQTADGLPLFDAIVHGKAEGSPRAARTTRLVFSPKLRRMIPIVQTYEDKEHKSFGYKRSVANAMLAGRPDNWVKDAEGYVVSWFAAYARPKGAKKSLPPWYPHRAKPDRDNVDKLICDAAKGILWGDDSRAFAGLQIQAVAPIGIDPFIRIVVIPWRIETPMTADVGNLFDSFRRNLAG